MGRRSWVRHAVLAIVLVAGAASITFALGHGEGAWAQQPISTTLPRRTTTSAVATTKAPTTLKPTTTAPRSATTVRRGTTTTGKKSTTTAAPTTLPTPSSVAAATTTTLVLTFRTASYNPLGLLVTLAGFGLAGGLMAREWVKTRP